MTTAEGQAALLALDGALSVVDFILEKVEEAKKEGLISPEEQLVRAKRINEIRSRVGAPAPATPTGQA